MNIDCQFDAFVTVSRSADRTRRGALECRVYHQQCPPGPSAIFAVCPVYEDYNWRRPEWRSRGLLEPVNPGREG